MHLVALTMYLFLFNENRMFPKKPLYQLNLGGIFLMAISLVSGAFFVIYGYKLNWLESEKIVWSLAICLLFSALFLIHQRTSKRPLYHYEIFKSKRVIGSIVLFFLFYVIKACMSNLYKVMASVWGWHWEYVLQVQYFNVLGTILGSITAYLLVSKKVDFKLIFTLGFLLLGVSIGWFSYLFSLDTPVHEVAAPLIVQGLSQGVLFTPLTLHMLGSVHPNISGSVSQSGTATRFWSSSIGFAVMQNALAYLTKKHQTLMTEHLDPTHYLFQSQWSSLMQKWESRLLNWDAIRASTLSISAQLQKQALIYANIEIFTFLSLLALGISIIIFIIWLVRKPKLKPLS